MRKILFLLLFWIPISAQNFFAHAANELVQCGEYYIPVLPEGKSIDLKSTAIEDIWAISYSRTINNAIIPPIIENPAGSWRAIYDEKYIYLLVQVNDKSLAPNQTWNGDAVEIYFRRTSSTNNEGQWGYGYNNNGTAGGASNAYILAADANPLVAGSHIMWNTETGYALKAAIPRSAIDEIQLAMEVAVNQANVGTSRLAQVATWSNANVDMYKNATGYTSVKLVKECPAIDLNVSSSRITEGESITLTANNMNEPGGLDYTWYKSTFNFAASSWITVEITGKTGNVISDSPLEKTVYKVKYNNKFSPDVTVLVNPLPLSETCSSELTQLSAETFGSLTSSACSRSDLSVDGKSGTARVKGLSYSTGPVSQGTYTLLKNAGETCFSETNGESWFIDDYDHTYNNNGAMLLVNNAGAGTVLYSNIIELPKSKGKMEFSTFLANAMYDESKTKSVILDLAVYAFAGSNYTQADFANENNWILVNRVETGQIQPSGQYNRLAWVECKIAFTPSTYSYVKVAIENNVTTNAGLAVLIDDISIKQCAGNSSIGIINPDATVAVYPNPGSVNRPVTIQTAFNSGMKVTVFNILGNIVCTVNSTFSTVELPAVFTPGYYIVRITGNSKETVSCKLIIR